MEVSETFRESFGRRLRRERERAGLSADSLAAALKIHRNTVYHLEGGEQWISSELLEKISHKLNINPAVFFTDEAVTIKPTPQEALAVFRELVEQSVAAVPIKDPLAGLDSEHRADALAFIDGLRHQQGLRSSKRDKRGS